MHKTAATIISALLVGELVAAGQTPQRSPSAVNDALVDIGGRRLHVSCTGTGSPTVILEAGLGDSSETWKAVQPAVAGFTRVCAYDRAGKGTSDPDPRPVAWLELQRELVSRSSQGRLVIAEKSGHYVQVEAPELVIQAIRDVVGAVRNGKP